MNGGSLSPENVSRETIERLEVFHDLVLKWNSKINLVSKRSINDIWARHIYDSAQLLPLAGGARLWCDMGSGGGFPGLVVAIMAMEQDSIPDVVLIESDVRKCVFLREAVRQLDLNAMIKTQRIETIPSLGADVVSARALADMSALLGYAALHLAPEGIALFMKGATWRKEVELAREHWSFDVIAHTSKTDPASAILEVKGIHRV